MNLYYYFYGTLLLLLFACASDDDGMEPLPPSTPTQRILHLGHTRMTSNADFNPALARINYDAYDLLLLGGDLAPNSSIDRPTMDSLEALFQLSNPRTLLALGNHDYDDLDLVTEYTGRPAFYTQHEGGITFLVLDTQDSLSSMVGEQLALIRRVTDTITESSHLVLLHHKLVWMYGNEDLEGQIVATANGQLGDCFHCINPNNFYETVYPLLVAVRQRGVEVLCIGGDLGFRTKTFDYLSPEGIRLMGSGMDLDAADNPALLFSYENRELTYEFLPLDALE
ncbi:MAG: hypothetical protein AAF146_01335 [Bacteroidota bacterium]